MKIKFIAICTGVLLTASSVQASGPQLVFDSVDSDPYVVEISKISKIEFRSEGLNIHSSEERMFPYSSFKKLAFDLEGTLIPSEVKSLGSDSESFGVYMSRGKDRMSLKGIDRDSKVGIYSMSGTCFLFIDGYAGGDIDISGLPSGIYIVRTADNCAKFIK